MLYAACSEARRYFALAQVKKEPLRELCFSQPKVECYESQALSFGATASVVDFNRFARFLHHVGECLLVPWVNCFEDYPVVTPSALARFTDLTLRALVELMGVVCAWDKMPAFSPVCSMLGIELDVSDLRARAS